MTSTQRSKGLKRFFESLPRVIFAYFVDGLIIVIPLVVTIWVIAWAYNLFDGLLAPILTLAFGRHIPALGFAISVTLVILIGFFGVRFGIRRVLHWMELRVVKIPFVGAIYGTTRQILGTLTSANSGKFLEVVFLEFPRKDIYAIGFVTGKARDKEGKQILNVFIPTAPNPLGGFLQIIRESDVIHSSMSINDAMKLVISAGRISHDDVAGISTPGQPEDIETIFNL
ncbi:MAG: DUF502 domain-containing protein [Chloroflexota bacterium]